MQTMHVLLRYSRLWLIGAPFVVATTVTLHSSTTIAAQMANRPNIAVAVTPLAIGSQTLARVEYNISRATVALEGGIAHKAEELTNTEIKETNESLISSGKQIAIMVSRYTEEARMAGWFWTLGAGYRQMDYTWKRGLSEDDLALASSLTSDDKGRYDHKLTAAGVTGHARAGYRYVGESTPFLIGAFVGLRHYQSTVNNVTAKDNEFAPSIADDQRVELSHRFMTRLEPALEIGWIF